MSFVIRSIISVSKNHRLIRFQMSSFGRHSKLGLVGCLHLIFFIFSAGLTRAINSPHDGIWSPSPPCSDMERDTPLNCDGLMAPSTHQMRVFDLRTPPRPILGNDCTPALLYIRSIHAGLGFFINPVEWNEDDDDERRHSIDEQQVDIKILASI